MASAAVESPAGFKAVNDAFEPAEKTDNDVTNKRSSDEAENEGPSTTTKKTKATPKPAAKGSNKKGTARKVVKKDVVGEDEDDAASAGVATPPSTPAPKKTAKNAKTPDTTASKKRGTPKGEGATPRGIPKSWEEAGPADRMLHRMREEGKDWNSIRKMWKDLTGEDTGNSSLPNRYNRMKCNLMRLEPGHDRILLEVKAQVEAGLEASKWAQINAGVKEKTGTAYQTAFLQKNVKELEAKGGLAALPEKSDEEEEGTGEGGENDKGDDSSSELSDIKSEVVGEDSAEDGAE